jgi:hypothetical protein
MFRISPGDGDGDDTVIIDNPGVSAALEQRPHNHPVAPQAPQIQRRPAIAITVVDRGPGAWVAEQHAHDLEVAFGRGGNQRGRGFRLGVVVCGVGPPCQQQPHLPSSPSSLT